MLSQNFYVKSSGAKQFSALAILFVCLFFGAAAARTFAQGNTPQNQLNGKIAFVRYEGRQHIYSINPDGTGFSMLSSFPNGAPSGVDDDNYPYFSWDGSKIYFTSYRDTNEAAYGETYVMNANGSSPTRLSFNAFGNSSAPFDTHPAISPDGTTIVFKGNCAGNNPSCLRTVSANGYTSTQSSNGSTVLLSTYLAFVPSYSPDGTKIIFHGRPFPSCSGDGCLFNIYVMNANGSGSPTALTAATSGESFLNARFSPDGTKIVYQHLSDIYVMDANGSNKRKLTTNGTNYTPSWSPDGTKIAYIKSSNTYNIYTINLDGTGETAVINNPDGTELRETSWQPSRVNVSPASNVSLEFGTVTQGGYTIAEPLSQNQFPAAAPQNYTFPQNAPAYEISTTATYSGTVDVTLQVPNIASAADCSKLRILHYTNNAWDDSGNSAPQYNAGTMVCTLTQTVTSFSPFAVAQVAAPTASSVTIGGRVMSGKRGVRNALVTLTEQDGTRRAVLTGVSGSYLFEEVAAGQTVIVSVRAKRITFSQPTQIFTVTEDFTGVNFYAHENFLRSDEPQL